VREVLLFRGLGVGICFTMAILGGTYLASERPKEIRVGAFLLIIALLLMLVVP
jgi:hypothetical protein